MNFSPGRSVPACYIELEWTIEGHQQRELFHEVRISGVMPPQNFFVMRYYPKTAGMFFSCVHVVDNSH